MPICSKSSGLSEAKGVRPSAAIFEDEYEVISKIGSGSYGEVFSARHRRTGSLHAIKSGSSCDARVKQTFSREVQALASLDHPHIISLKAFLTEGEKLYIVQELSGPDLLDYLAKSPLSRDGVPYVPESLASAILRQCLEAIVSCHDHGLAHRDVKLDNFVIADDGTVKLIDFGLASEVANGRETRAVGSADYLAPEAAAQKSRPSAAADVWSLGVVLFGLLTGESFLPGDVSCIAEARTYLHNPAFVRERLRASPGALAISDSARDLLEQLLRYDPTERVTSRQALSHPFITSSGSA